MKNTFFTLIILMLAGISYGQEITGAWYGKLSIPGNELRLVFHIEKTDTGLKATMDSPDQNARGIPVSSVSFENMELILGMPALMAEYKGRMNDNAIDGTFSQAGMSFAVRLTREMPERLVKIRPQEPAGELPYRSEDIVFFNSADQLKLAGTITIPAGQGPFPALVLISGSGPQNRNSEVFGHKPFLVLSDYLTRNGIAVLRFDDRGTGASGGDFSSATSVEFSRDALAAVDYLASRPEVNRGRIGLAGHSEGGLIAPMAAVESEKVAFLIILAGPGLPGDKIILKQQQLIGRVNQMGEDELVEAAALNRAAFDIVKSITDLEEIQDSLNRFFNGPQGDFLRKQKPQGMDEASYVASVVRQLANPWMKFFLAHDPAPVLEKVKIPVLSMTGEKDLQVEPDENLKAIGKALDKAGNTDVTLKKLTGLNHLFQECKTGSPAEYAQIEQTFSPSAMEEILNWIKKLH